MSAVCLLCVVAAVTFAVRAYDLPLAIFAASAAKVAAGEIWLLPASALVVDRPIDVGLVAFGLLGFAALWMCGTRVFWVVAVVGHIGSTLAVYAIIGVSRLTDPDVFSSAVARQDFGVSAIQGAWVGAIAATAWRWAGADHRARAVVAAGVWALAGVAWWLHPDPSILTTEHLFAFLVGCGVVLWPRLAASSRTLVAGFVSSPRQDATTTS
jgi:multisubunit Na+/H+ antiporter MnhG subunit